ncbi:MAG: DUF6152 family protein [Pseudohongiellaceae bacterium]|jgi:hypothetical protein
MKHLTRLLLGLWAGLCLSIPVFAHHNTQTEYGAFDSATIVVEGTIGRVHWGNPHIGVEITTTGGDVEAGKKWRVNSHPIQIQIDHGFNKEDFVTGASIKVIGWQNLRGLPTIWPRAIQVGSGPMKSNMRFTDMIDIAKGTFTSMNIVPAANLNGSPSARAGEPYVAKLREMGLLDAKDNMIWPAPQK